MSTTWPGAQLYQSTDGGQTYQALYAQVTPATIGNTIDALPDFSQGNIFDSGNAVTVQLVSGSALLSITEDQVLNGMNLAVLGAPGRWEVIQFQTATLTAPNTYRLSRLLRGRRGSEWACGTHQVGDRFILASLTAWNRVADSDIGLPRLYKAPPFKIALSSVPPTTFTNSAVALMPYAPVNLAGVRDGSGNLTFTWQRRSRLGNSTLNLPVVLGETSEAYSIDIVKAGAVVRTLSATSPSVTYSAADQTTDGITPGAAVTAKVYQISAAVGRGYPLEGTV